MEQPKDTPSCCGTDAKWVEQTPNIQYWYCGKCKNEVVPGAATSGVALRALGNPGTIRTGFYSTPVQILGEITRLSVEPVLGNYYRIKNALGNPVIAVLNWVDLGTGQFHLDSGDGHEYVLSRTTWELLIEKI